MSIENLKGDLQRLHQKIMGWKGDVSLSSVHFLLSNADILGFKKVVQHELLHLIEENPLLKDEYDEHIFYFHRLAEDKEYQEFIAGIHALMHTLYTIIEHDKLPAFLAPNFGFIRPKGTKVYPHTVELEGLQTTVELARFVVLDSLYKILTTEPHILSMREFHSTLIDESQWWKLGEEGMSYQAGDYGRCQWKPVLEQYEMIAEQFVPYLWIHKCLPDTEECKQYTTSLQAKVKRLKNMFEGPHQRLHMHDFDYFDWFARRDEKNVRIKGEDVTKAKGWADTVCGDLLQFLEDQEDSGTVEPINAKVSHEEHQKEMSELGASQSTESDNTVLFKENGSVFIGKKKVGTVPTGTIYYCFFEYLYKKRGEVISYKDITSHILEWDKKIGSAISKTPNAYCQNLKCDLVERASIPRDTLHVLIKSGRTKDKKLGYKMEESVDMTRIQPESS